MRVQSLGWEDSLEEGMATHSSILTWRIPRTEESGTLQSIGLQRVGHYWSNWVCTHEPLKKKKKIHTSKVCPGAVLSHHALWDYWLVGRWAWNQYRAMQPAACCQKYCSKTEWLWERDYRRAYTRPFQDSHTSSDPQALAWPGEEEGALQVRILNQK